ncbi:T9SS type A sorting domain-containing protein [Fluviicola sp.]|uniref:T9SS type A sorting domain-containing protein n=1 Tax=Fluviicola sp. TaxID=1917219 RepID=UPI002638DB29|nr:T9SS type A sorting domain-containing protein [Fluviicola sp.]
MKKQFLFISFIGATGALNAQSFPNGGFENWVNHTLYEDPQYWSGTNAISIFGADPSAIKSTDAHGGTYALKLKTSVSDVGGDGEMDTIPAVLMLGTIDMVNDTEIIGHPFSHRPDSLVGWYKLSSPGNVPFQLEFSSSKWNSGSGSPETVGAALFEGGASANYIRFSVPVNYLSNATPDSIQVFIINTTDESVVTNELYLDDLSFVYNTLGITENTAQIELYPNPVTNQLTVQSDEPVQYISVKDIHGKQLFEMSGNTEIYQVETSHFTSGVYFCDLVFSNGSSKRLKFVKQ